MVSDDNRIAKSQYFVLTFKWFFFKTVLTLFDEYVPPPIKINESRASTLLKCWTTSYVALFLSEPQYSVRCFPGIDWKPSGMALCSNLPSSALPFVMSSFVLKGGPSTRTEKDLFRLHRTMRERSSGERLWKRYEILVYLYTTVATRLIFEYALAFTSVSFTSFIFGLSSRICEIA